MESETVPLDTPPAKFSRYRSVRQARVNQAQGQAQAQYQKSLQSDSQQMPPMPPVPSVAPVEPQNPNAISRSMSRYHRRSSNSPAAKAPPLRSATIHVPPLPTTTETANNPRYRALSSSQAQVANNVQPRISNTSRTRVDATPSRTTRDEAKQLMQDEAERHRRIKEKQDMERRTRAKAEQAEREQLERQHREEEEAERLRAEKKAEEAHEAQEARRQHEDKERGKRLQKAESARRVQERDEAACRARAEERPPQSPPVSPPRHGGALGMFRRKADGPSSPGSPPDSSISAKPPHTSHSDRELDYIKAGASFGIDAPISAVNAGDRRVTIVCNKKRILLPVTPDTTAHDLLKSAALCMTEAINPRTDIVIENFHKLGVQRPVRLFEHVRDILNSWDNDNLNDLEIVNALFFGQVQSHLVATDVPNKRPEDASYYMHHSCRPGRWSKRCVTLRSDGQISLSKNEEAKDLDNICHLSDFDIYYPTKKKLKAIKPPKKFCYTIKSQQKSNIFSDESRFAHFFATNDPQTAIRFLSSVQEWRSWHLKHVMGEGQKKAKTPDVKPTVGVLANAKALSCLEQNGTSSHNRSTSVGSYYQLGSFKPLFDADSFGKDIKAVSSANDLGVHRTNTKVMHARKMSTRGRNPPPAAYERSGVLINDVPSVPAEPASSLTENTVRQSDDAFAATGLLGRTYTQKQKALQDREKKNAGPFTEGPSLVSNIDALVAAANESGLNRKTSAESSTHRRTSSDIQRSVSTRIKPLVDLTPQYREPPQHRNKGKGFNPGVASGPLVENATSIEEAVKIPSSTDWRRPATARAHGTHGVGGFDRTKSLKGQGLANFAVNNHDGAPGEADNAFTGGGLLAQAGFSQGHQPVGRGVMDGSKARGPMLDMSENSQFASGSLLADMHRKQAADRRRSVDMG
ncbi:hypothetical protein CC80DRAFT_453974 [Byssothecium circinans]|uniref:PH domain-containing protein n=1 Tax=Byssothecium circinans TaxID=147558 RepID=A0A6A5TGB8_9PLEO|nr:hypothetical protein CC80DRAFT_453974 [Byssothecium circinans]